MFQNTHLRNFIRATRYTRKDVIHKDLSTPKFKDMLPNSKEANPALYSISHYNNRSRNCERPRAILALRTTWFRFPSDDGSTLGSLSCTLDVNGSVSCTRHPEIGRFPSLPHVKPFKIHLS